MSGPKTPGTSLRVANKLGIMSLRYALEQDPTTMKRRRYDCESTKQKTITPKRS